MVLGARLSFVFAILLALAMPVRSGEILLVLSEGGGAYAEFSEALEKSLQGTSWWIVDTVLPENLAISAGAREADVWVTVGNEATRAALSSGKAPAILASMLTRSAFESLLAQQSSRPSGGLSALVLEQPLARQLQFLQALFPNKRRVGVLIGPDSRGLASVVHQESLRHGFAAELEDAVDEAGLIPAANRLLSRSDVLLALPDRLLYGRNSAHAVILTSYRLQRPILAFSPGLVNAGALAALYSTPAQFARQVAALLGAERRKMSLIQWPEQFTILYNRSAARSLGIELPEETTVMRALERRRNEP